MSIDPNADKTLSPFGEACLKLWEEGSLLPKLIAYDDGTGTWTIAWGCTEGVYRGMTCTPAQAEAMYQAEIAKFIAAVHGRVTVELTQSQFDALVSFLYNLGTEAAPGLIAAINAQDWDSVQAIWPRWNKARQGAGGPLVVNAGLVSRRANELKLWNGTYVDRRITPDGLPSGTPKSVTQTVAQSPSLRMQISALVLAVGGGVMHGLQYISGAIGSLTDYVPQVQTSVEQVMGPAQGIAKSAGIPWDNIAYLVAGVLIVATIIRLTAQKRAQ